jgi:hypothetical protein
MLNLCLCIDIMYTIQKPFSPASGRVVKYYGVSFLAGLLSFSYYVAKVRNEPGKCIQAPTTVVLEALPQNELLVEILLLYFFMAILSTIFMIKKLFRSGFNSEGRTFFFKKQFGYVLAFSVLWQIQVLSTYFYLFNITDDVWYEDHPKESTFGTIVAICAGVALLSYGIIITLLRIREPLFQIIVI